MTNVTAWFLLNEKGNEKGEFSFNHIENGHCLNPLPTPKTPVHVKPWSKGTWKSQLCTLTDSMPPQLLFIGEQNVDA